MGSLKEDWITYDKDISKRGLWVMAVYRYGKSVQKKENRYLKATLFSVYRFFKIVVEIVTGIEVPLGVKLGKGFKIEHFGDIIIEEGVQIGDDVLIRNGVTIGSKSKDQQGVPFIGSRVDIGAGAKIMGRITVGDDVVIGANAVVIKDVPPNSIAVGVPARIIPRKK